MTAVTLPVFEVDVAVLPRAGFPARIRAGEAEREQVARACRVNRIDRLEADLDVLRWRRDGVQIRGELRATLEQDCVVTLEPVIQDISEHLDETFLPEGSELARARGGASDELVLDPEGPDVPETFSGDVIDLWPVIVEFLMLAIDPFPRAPGAELDRRFSAGGKEAPTEDSPFAALGKLKKNQS